MVVLQWINGLLIILFTALSIYFSFRYRRSADGVKRGLLQAKMNLSMGAMLVFIAAAQLVLLADSTVRVVVGALFLVLGVFNLVAGFRNHQHYSMLDESRSRS